MQFHAARNQAMQFYVAHNQTIISAGIETNRHNPQPANMVGPFVWMYGYRLSKKM